MAALGACPGAAAATWPCATGARELSEPPALVRARSHGPACLPPPGAAATPRDQAQPSRLRSSAGRCRGRCVGACTRGGDCLTSPGRALCWPAEPTCRRAVDRHAHAMTSDPLLPENLPELGPSHRCGGPLFCAGADAAGRPRWSAGLESRRQPERDLGEEHDQQHGGDLHQHERPQRAKDLLQRDLGRCYALQVEGSGAERR